LNFLGILPEIEVFSLDIYNPVIKMVFEIIKEGAT